MFTAHNFDKSETKSTFFKIPMKKMLPIVLTVVAGVALSVIGMNLTNYKVESDRQIEFDKSVSSVLSRVQNATANQEQVVKNLDGLFAASVQVVRDVFELYSTVPAKSNPYILSIGYASKVTAQDADNFVYYNRSERYYDYQIKPSGTRSLYQPISYIVPFEQNAHLSGYDLLSNQTFSEIIQKAQTKKGLVCSPVFNFRGSDTNSIVLMQTVEKKKSASSLTPEESLFQTTSDMFDGIIYVELNATKFLKTVIGDSVGSDKNIVFDFYDDNKAGLDKSVFSSNNKKNLTAAYKQIIAADKFITIGDRQFRMRFANAQEFGSGIQAYLGWITLALGLLTTFGLAGFLYSVVSSNQRALDIADKITSSNRRILESSRDIIATFDLAGVWKSVNPAVTSILGYETQEVEGRHISKFLAGDNANESIYSILERTGDESAENFVVPMKTKAGHIRWVNWSFAKSQAEQCIYCTGRDITEAKFAEEEIQLKSRQVELAEQLALEANDFKSNFLVRLTDHLRQELTGTLSGLHKIASNIDYSDDNQLAFLKMANNSSDQLYNIVNDLIDVANEGKNANGSYDRVTLHNCLLETARTLKDKYLIDRECSIDYTNISHDAAIKGDSSTISNAFSLLVSALTDGMRVSKVELYADTNAHEKVMEIQILGPENKATADMIKLYNVSTNSLMENLRNDENNILFRLAVASSQIRRMNGNMSTETLGEEGNVVLITLPMPQ